MDKKNGKSGVVSPPPLSQTQHHTKAAPGQSALHDWEVGSRYSMVKLLGKGSYGKVAEAIDRYVCIS
jgi:hypothetical protein